MANIPVQMPYLQRQVGNLNTQKSPVSNGSNTFLAGSFVQVNASGEIQATPTSSSTALTTKVYGWVGEKSTASTDIPPVAFFGAKHYPFDPTGATFEISVTDGSANVATGTPSITGLSLVVGGSYGLIRPTTGDYTGYQFLNGADTTNPVVQIVSLGDNAATDLNPRVRVKVLATSIQS